MKKFLNDLDRQMQKDRLAHSPDGNDVQLNVDALRSTHELRLLTELYLRGWTWEQIEPKLDKIGRDRRLRS